MLLTAIILSVFMGVTLGLLGGGGSILTVPILVYVVGLGSKEAIATSLLVVGVTSAVGAVQHARAGNVRYKTGLVFGGVAMVGAFGGGLVAAYLSGTTLLIAFAALMVVTGIAMLRKRSPSASDDNESEHPFSLGKVIAEGLVVGAVTGLVGAGGGFLVVPALLLFGGLGMRAAIGTSLLVIALKAFAGLAGHLSYVSIDWQLAAMVTVAAVVGSLAGTRLAKRIEPSKLRKGFAVFVLAMAAFMLYREAPASVLQALFVERWPFWAGGFAIGAFVVLLLLYGRKMLGVSRGFGDVCAAPFDGAARRSWRLPFLVGIVGGGLLAALAAGGWAPSFDMGMFDQLVTDSLPAKAAIFTAGGVVIGFGARLAGGCTSGHGILGVAQLAPSSLIATGAFMASGFAVTNLLLRVFAS